MSLFLLLIVLFIFGFGITLFFLLNAFVDLARYRVPYVSTPGWTIDWLSRNARFSNGAVLYDLGCGDARMLIALKKKFSNITAKGLEGALWPYVLSRWKTHGKGIVIHRQDFYHADIHDADVIFCFLVPSAMPRLEKFLRSQLKAGTVVYSYALRFPTWQPVQEVINPKNPKGSKLLIYQA